MGARYQHGSPFVTLYVTCRDITLWRCQSTEAAKPRQHIGYISPNRTQATKATLSDPYNEGYESILHVFDLQHLAATVHATLQLPDLPRANLRPKQCQNA